MEIMTLEGKTAHRGGDVCVMCVSLAKSLPRGSFFVPAGTHLAVKLLTAQPLGAHVCAQLFNELHDGLITFLLFVR